MGILHVGECLASGAEHRVYRQLGSDEVVKVPARWAKLWQTMNEGVARRDLDVLQCEGIDIIPTEVLGTPTLQFPDGSRQEAPYALVQPFVQARPVRVEDLARPEISEPLAKLFTQSQDLYRREHLGVDFVGFATLYGLVRTFFKDRIDVAIHNVLVTEGQAPEVFLCDTRLYDMDGFRPGTKNILFSALHLQHEMVGQVLDQAGHPIERTADDPLARLVGEKLYSAVRTRL